MELTPQGLPIIDLSRIDTDHGRRSIAKYISKACHEAGCFYIKNHTVDSNVIENVFEDLKTFFMQAEDYKLKFIEPNGSTERGYQQFEIQNANAFMGKLGLPNDPLEKLAFGPPEGFVRPVLPNIYPDVPGSLKVNVDNYFESIRVLSEKLLKVFSIAAEAPSEHFFYEYCHEGEHSMKCNFYPKYSSPKPSQHNRLGEHTDCTPITILATDNTPGSLQVINAEGNWVYAEPIPDCLFVNLGDFMAVWTNDQWKATIHKVVWPKDGLIKDRLSVVFFIVPNPRVVAECLPSCLNPGEKPKYPPISIQDYIRTRMDRFAKGY